MLLCNRVTQLEEQKYSALFLILVWPSFMKSALRHNCSVVTPACETSVPCATSMLIHVYTSHHRCPVPLWSLVWSENVSVVQKLIYESDDGFATKPTIPLFVFEYDSFPGMEIHPFCRSLMSRSLQRRDKNHRAFTLAKKQPSVFRNCVFLWLKLNICISSA